MRSALAITALAALTGCPGGNGTDLPEGCITVNGSGGWAFLSDALTQAEDGDSVELCGEITDTVVINRDITFTGEFNMQGQFTSAWFPPDNEPALRIMEGGSVTMDGVYIDTTRNGITVEEGASLQISRSFIQVQNPGSYGIEIVGGDVTADNIVINEAFWGAIQNTGGTLALRDSDLINSLRWGVRLDNGATATIEDTLIGGTTISDETGANNDGWAVFVCDTCQVDMTNVDLQANVLGGLYVDLGVANVTGGEWLGNFMGGWVDGGTLNLTDVDITDPIQYGLVSQSGTLTMTDVRMDADPENGRFEDVLTGNLEGTYGLIAFDGEATWVGGGAREFNGGGAFIQGNQAAQFPLVLQNLSFADNAALGIQASLTDLEATNVKVTGTRFVEACVADFTYNCNWAVAAFQSDVDWIGGSVRDNGAMGIVVSDGPSDFTGLELANNDAYGIWVLAGVVNLIDSDIHGWGEVALEVMNGSFLTLTDSDIHDRDYTSSFISGEFDYRTALNAVEIEAIDSTVQVSNSVFRNGNNGILGYSNSNITVEDTLFLDYNRFGVQASGGTLDIDRTAFDRIGGDAIVCTGNAEATIERTTITNMTKVQNVFETYRNGVLENSSMSELSLPALRTNTCKLDVGRLTFEGLEGPAIDMNNTVVDEFDRVVVRGANLFVESGRTAEPAVDMTWSSVPAELSISNLSVSGVPRGVAVRLTNTFSESDEVSINDLTVSQPQVAFGDNGVEISGIAGISLTEFNITAPTGSGLVLTNTSGIIGDDQSPNTIADSGAVGLVLTNSDVVVSNLSVTGALGDGVSVIGASPTFNTVSISAAGYGMNCTTEPSVPACVDVTATGGLGEHLGCEACFTASVP